MKGLCDASVALKKCSAQYVCCCCCYCTCRAGLLCQCQKLFQKHSPFLCTRQLLRRCLRGGAQRLRGQLGRRACCRGSIKAPPLGCRLRASPLLRIRQHYQATLLRRHQRSTMLLVTLASVAKQPDGTKQGCASVLAALSRACISFPSPGPLSSPMHLQVSQELHCQQARCIGPQPGNGQRRRSRSSWVAQRRAQPIPPGRRSRNPAAACTAAA